MSDTPWEKDPHTGLPIGIEVDATPARRPEGATLAGRYVTLTSLDAAAHTDALYEEGKGSDELFRYLFFGPYPDRDACASNLQKMAASTDPLYYAILDADSGKALGHAAYLRIEPAHRSIEVGGILYTPSLQQTRGATEAMYLMARHVFDDLGYRRYEWKCDALNAPSRKAAVRLGFKPEGVFRQHMIIKGRTRDTAWYSMMDHEWPMRKASFEQWLAPDNFDAAGRQRVSLSQLNGAV